MHEQTLFEQLGGEVTLNRATESLYAKVVLDDELVGFFNGVDVNRVEKRQREFLTFVFDGPGQNPKIDLRSAHAKLVGRGLNHHHFDLLVGHLCCVLQELGINDSLMGRCLARVESTRKDVMGEVYSNQHRVQSMISRCAGFAYGLLCYAVGMVSLVYSAAWLGDFLLPITLDSARTGSLSGAIAINFALVVIFSIQHSVMARPGFKEKWTQVVPACYERSTYVLLSGFAFIGLMYFWQPIGIEIWHLTGNAEMVMYAGYGVGWGLLVAATFAVNHFDLFGLRQVWLNLRGKKYVQLPFTESNMYRFSRHPIYVGWLMVIWFTPHMTASHLFFATGITIYTLGAIRFEERDLIRFHPEYAQYQKRVGKLLPKFKRSTLRPIQRAA
tara:strand:+ start:76697 stop:77851 length:1155 start_codon:yes stop_codon:yes gene_type:complete